MNVPNQDQIKVRFQVSANAVPPLNASKLVVLVFCLVIQVYVPHILELIEMSPVNSDLQLGALRLLTNLSVTDQHQHLLKTSIRLLLSLLVVGNETLQVCFFVFLKKNHLMNLFLMQLLLSVVKL